MLLEAERLKSFCVGVFVRVFVVHPINFGRFDDQLAVQLERQVERRRVSRQNGRPVPPATITIRFLSR